MKNQKRIAIIIGIIIIAIVGVIVFCLVGNKTENRKNDKEKNNSTENTETYMSESEPDTTTDDSTVEDTETESPSIQIETLKPTDELTEGEIDLQKIQGYASKYVNKEELGNNKDDGFNHNDGDNAETDTDDSQQNSRYRLSDGNLILLSVGSYMGNYLEDGSDTPIENVAAIVVKNNSDNMLQVADITFAVAENETAVFRITNLLPGKSVMVLEMNKREYKESDNYDYGEVATAYRAETSLMEDTFDIVKENGTLTLKNKTTKSYKKVYVYYKYAHIGGVFMGGITYRVPFENIEANASVESVANHFNVNSSIITDVQITEE